MKFCSGYLTNLKYEIARELFPPQRPKGFLSGGEDLLGNVRARTRFSTLRPHLFRTVDLYTECSNLCCGERRAKSGVRKILGDHLTFRATEGDQ